MSATTTKVVRQAVASRITGIGAPWNEAPVPFDLHTPAIAPDSTPSSKLHGSFSVGLPRSAVRPGERHQVSVGVRLTTDIVVRFFARVAPKGALAAVDAALDLELALVQRLDTGWSQDLTMYLSGIERRTISTGEWMQIDAVFSTSYLVALS